MQARLATEERQVKIVVAVLNLARDIGPVSITTGNIATAIRVIGAVQISTHTADPILNWPGQVIGSGQVSALISGSTVGTCCQTWP